MATNLDLQAQLNQLLADQNKMLEESTKLIKDQVTVTRDLVNAMRSANFKDVTDDVKSAQQAIQQASQSTQNYGSTNQDVFDKVQKSMQEAIKNEMGLGKGMDDLGKKVKKFAVAASAIDGFVQGLRFTYNMMHSITSLGSGLVGTLGHIGAAIISIPFKMLSGLIHMADSGGGSNELQQALEDIRKEFGSLRETSGRAVVDMARSMKGDLAGTGLAVTRVFGNLAERLKTMQEYAHNLGPLFAVLSGQFMKNAEAIGAYYKGLGLTEEAQKAVATRSYALGTALTEELRQIANYSLQLSKAFNGAAGSAKEISRDMGTLMSDFKHFGGISTKEIGQAVVYFRRLGVEVSKVLGVIDQYDNFESAAQGAAHLSQAFNLNVDALEMMKAQNPAQRVEMLRKAFFQAGRSVENMTRQERALLAQQSGLDDSALDLVFSMKNQGMSYDQVTKKADAAKKKQLSQAEAMTKLADSIERLVRSGSSGSGGFLDRFIQGFTVGIQRSSEFRTIMRNLRIDLRTAYVEGIKVGRAFVDMFPGVKDVFKGIADLFEPRRFRAMFDRVKNTFKDFFKNMTTDPQTALPRLLDRLKDDFFSWFEPNNQNGHRILDGFKKFFVAMSNIAGGLLKVAIENLTKGIRFITDLVSGRASLTVPGGSGALGFMGQLIQPILGAVKTAGPALWGALKDMFGALWKKAEPWISRNWLKVVGVLFAPSMAGIVGRTIATTLATAFAGGLFSWLKGGGVTKAFSSVQGLFNNQVGQVAQAMTKLPNVPHGAGGAGGAAAEAIRGADQAANAAGQSRITGGTIAKMALITTFIMVGMAGLMYGIFRFAKAMHDNHLDISHVLGASAAMVATSGAMVMIAGAIRAMSAINLNAGMLGRIVVGVGLVGGVGALMAYGAKQLVDQFGDIPTAKLAKTALIMTATGAFFLAAAGVTALAGVVGGIALAGGGLGTVAIGAGLALISATIAVMATQGLSIMRTIDAFRPSPGFVEKAKAFVSIMEGIGRFSGNIAQIVAATRPSILSFITGTGEEEQRRTLGVVNTIITTMGTQLQRIMTTIRRNIDGLSGSEQQLKAGEMFGSVLTGVAGLADALKPPAEALQEPGLFAQFFGNASTVRNLDGLANYVQQVDISVRNLMQRVMNILNGSIGQGITESQKRSIEVIPGLLSSMAAIARAMMPSPALVQELNKGSDFAGQIQHLNRFVTSVFGQLINSDLFSRIGGVVTSVATALTREGLTKQQAEALKAGLPVIGATFAGVAGIASAITNLSQDASKGAGNIFQATQFVSTLFESLRTQLPALLTSMMETFRGADLRSLRNVGVGMNAVKTLVESIASISGGNIPSPTELQSGFVRMGAALSVIQTKMADLNNQLSASTGFGTTAEELANQIRTKSLARVGHAVRDMVTQVNHISTAIRGLSPINIDTELQRLGDHLGLGRDGTVTIQNRNFTLNVNFSVKLDNNGLDALELAMIRRNGPHPTRLRHGDVD